MIVVDPSALIAILLGEEDAARYVTRIEQSSAIFMSAASYVELFAVLSRKRGSGITDDADSLLREVGVTVEPVTPEQAEIARAAYVQYGVLNFGDVFSYALAKSKGLPLLFKGGDFSQTDVERAAG